MTEEEKMLAGEIYDANYDEGLYEKRMRAKELCKQFNECDVRDVEKKKDILEKLFQKRIDIIYFAYLYDIGNSNPRTEIDNLKKVKEIFSNFHQVEFKSALEGSLQEKQDGVLILKRGGK